MVFSQYSENAPITHDEIEDAVRAGDLEMVKVLMANAPYTEARVEDLLPLAISCGQYAIAKFIYEQYANGTMLPYGNTLVEYGTPALIVYFVDKVINPEEMYNFAVLYEKRRVIELLNALKVPPPDDLLNSTISTSSDEPVELVKTLLDIGCRPDDDTLELAMRRGYDHIYEVCKRLVY